MGGGGRGGAKLSRGANSIRVLNRGNTVSVIKKHTLALLCSLYTVKLLYSGHHQDHVKGPAIRSCPLDKLVFRCFGPLSLKSPANNFYHCYFCTVSAKKVFFNF